MNTDLDSSPSRFESAHSVDMDSLYSRSPHLLNLDEFLAESNSTRALEYWVREFESYQRLDTGEELKTAIFSSIADIDHLINDQLNAIIHHPRLQKLEASWRGLWMLAEQADGIKNLKIKILDISWLEVSKDISRALEFDQSALFHKVYSEEYGSPGGEPYGVLIGDYSISHKPSTEHPYNDIATLEGLTQVAAASFSPFIAAASPSFFGMESFSELGQPINLKSIFRQQEYIPWNALREKSDSRFIGLTIPKILMRLPYRKTPGSYKGLFFHEHTNQESDYLWGNAGFAFAKVLIREFHSVGWFGHIRGVPRNQLGGGLLANLVVDSWLTDKEGLIHKPATDVVLIDDVEKELSELGFIPLCQCYDTPFAAFYNNQSIQNPSHTKFNTTEVNARLSAMMQHVLCGSRVAHYIKVMIRDKIGSFISAIECESFLRKWLFKYTTGRDDLEWEEQARFPLREATVKVNEHPDKPGQYLCVIHIVPHYQIDQMVSELELVTELVHSR